MSFFDTSDHHAFRNSSVFLESQWFCDSEGQLFPSRQPTGGRPHVSPELRSRAAYQEFSKSQMTRAYEVMQELGVMGLSGRRFGHMSTGEQRRFLFGRQALVHDPPVLVFDEPTSGLDLKACFQYLDLLRAQMAKGKTVLLVTHHLHEIPPEIDRVIFLKAGNIVADGSKLTLLTSDQISGLFDSKNSLVQANGWYQALPG